MRQFEQALNRADLAAEIFALRRVVELRVNPALAVGDRDRHIVHLIQMFKVLSACGIARQPRLDQAHDPINKNRAIRDRYAQYRNAQQQPVAAAPAIPAVTVLNPDDVVPY